MKRTQAISSPVPVHPREPRLILSSQLDHGKNGNSGIIGTIAGSLVVQWLLGASRWDSRILASLLLLSPVGSATTTWCWRPCLRGSPQSLFRTSCPTPSHTFPCRPPPRAGEASPCLWRVPAPTTPPLYKLKSKYFENLGVGVLE